MQQGQTSAGAGAEPAFSTIDIFAGRKDGEPFFISIADAACSSSQEALARARRDGQDDNPARLLYLILDTIVDLYFPAIDHYDDRIDELEDRVVAEPEPQVLQQVFALKRELIDLRRVLVGTRDATLHLQRDPQSIIDAEHQPFVRDIYDHVVRLLDSVETQRDLVNNALDIYLSSVANRTNEVMKVLTVLGTIALPVIAISGVYGMNLKGLPFQDSPHGAWIVGAITIGLDLDPAWGAAQDEVALRPRARDCASECKIGEELWCRQTGAGNYFGADLIKVSGTGIPQNTGQLAQGDFSYDRLSRRRRRSQ